jgi:hypothetical protein
MSESTATAAAETPVAPVSETTSPPQPAPQATPANVGTPGTPESNAQQGSGAGEPAAAKPDEGQQGDDAETARKKQSAQERINEMNAKWRTEQRQRQALEAEIARYRQLQPPPPNAPLEEHDDFRLKKVVRGERVEQLQTEVERIQVEAWESVTATVAAKAEAAADRMPGLVDKLKALPKLSAPTVQFMAESEKGAEIAYHLANNPAEASRIADLPPLHQGIELARLEGKLSVAPQIRKVSTAPSPVPTVTGNPSPASRDPHDMSQAEYNEWYRKRNKRG